MAGIEADPWLRITVDLLDRRLTFGDEVTHFRIDAPLMLRLLSRATGSPRRSRTCPRSKPTKRLAQSSDSRRTAL